MSIVGSGERYKTYHDGMQEGVDPWENYDKTDWLIPQPTPPKGRIWRREDGKSAEEVLGPFKRIRVKRGE